MDPNPNFSEFFNPNDGTSSDELEDTINEALSNVVSLATRRLYEGESSRPRRRGQYIDREREKGHQQLVRDYFSEDPPPLYSDYMFRRRFRMRKSLFLRIVNQLSTTFEYFRQSRDATGRLGLSPLQKCTAAIRMLAYRMCADQVDEYLRMGQSTARECLANFVEGIMTLYRNTYLRRPTKEDLQ